MSKPVFSSADQQLLWQGMEKLIDEAQQHMAAVLKGVPEGSVKQDEDAKILVECYTKRIKKCRSIQAHLPQLKKFTTDKMPAA